MKTLENEKSHPRYLLLVEPIPLSRSNMMFIYLSMFKGLLTHFMPQVSFNTPWKHQKTFSFLMFSGGIERDLWHEID